MISGTHLIQLGGLGHLEIRGEVKMEKLVLIGGATEGHFETKLIMFGDRW